MGIRVFVVFCENFSDPLFGGNGVRVCGQIDLRRIGDRENPEKLHQEVVHGGLRLDLEAVIILKNDRQGIAVAIIQLGVNTDLVQGIALLESIVADLNLDFVRSIIALAGHFAAGKDE